MMGKKGKELSQDLRNQIVELHTKGTGYRRISQLLTVNKSTVGAIIRKWKEVHSTVNRPRTGAPRKISHRAVRKLVRSVAQEPSTTLTDLQKDLEAAGTVVTLKTIGNTLHRNGFRPRLPRKTPLVKKSRGEACLKFAAEQVEQPGEGWEDAGLSEETHIQQSCCSIKKEHVVNCQFSVWYPIFQKHTIKSLILPLPQNVIDYLLDDGTLVVSGGDNNTWQTQTKSSDSEGEEDVQVHKTYNQAPEFPEFNSRVLEAINALGGGVFPKLNWSAPRDANWTALNSSLQCQSLSDIFLLFKSSDFIAHDLTQPFRQCSEHDSSDPAINYELVLRKWSELVPGGEFRCFIKENKLIGISQRDYTQHYQHISKQEAQISHSIQEFFSQHIQYQFLDQDFVLDVYRDSGGKVWVIDLNPFGEVTDSLLFTWEELTSGTSLSANQEGGDSAQQESPAFRYTTSEVMVQPSPCVIYQVPRDFDTNSPTSSNCQQDEGEGEEEVQQ